MNEFELQRKAFEEQIHLHASLLDQVHNAVIGAGIDGAVTYWNKYAEVLFAWTAEEA